MQQPDTILCPAYHHPQPRGTKFCMICGSDMVLNNPGPRYYLTRIIREGGQGAVYEGIDDAGRVYAIKEMLDQFTNQRERDEAVVRFEAEAALLKRLNHPNIPKVYSAFTDDGRRYLVMDLVRGEDLGEVVERRGAIPESEVLGWAAQICTVLNYLHTQNPPIIFRDIKPSNIMLEPGGTIKFVDFGIAKAFQAAKRGTQIGTPGYAPPEQYQGMASIQSDIFALAATLHHLLTGRDPQNESPFSFPDVRTLRPSISQHTAEAIAHALQMRPEDRFPSIATFCAALQPSTAQPTRARSSVQTGAPNVVIAPKNPTTAPAATVSSTASPSTAVPPTAVLPGVSAGQQTASAPAQRSFGWLRTVLIALVLLSTLLAAGVLFATGAINFNSGPTSTPETLIQQTFQANGLTIILPNGTDTQGVYQGFVQAFTQAAKSQFGANVVVQTDTLHYISGQEPQNLGLDSLGRGTTYRASMEGTVLVPRQ